MDLCNAISKKCTQPLCIIISQKYDVIKNYRSEQSDIAEILALGCKNLGEIR